MRKIHPSEVALEKYIANRDDYLYHDITDQAEKEFDASRLTTSLPKSLRLPVMLVYQGANPRFTAHRNST